MNIVILNDEQLGLIDELKEASRRFSTSPELISSRPAIELARRLVERAYDLKIPEIAIIDVQAYVRMFDNEERLPPHLRAQWFPND